MHMVHFTRTLLDVPLEYMQIKVDLLIEILVGVAVLNIVFMFRTVI